MTEVYVKPTYEELEEFVGDALVFLTGLECEDPNSTEGLQEKGFQLVLRLDHHGQPVRYDK